MEENINESEFDEEPPANSMEELLFRELAVLKLGLHRDARPPFQLRYSEDSGRGLIATRNIGRGDIIMGETPAVWGPKASGAACLECGQQVQNLALVHFCNLCHLHFCSMDCSKTHPIKECTEMQKLSIKNDSLELMGKLTLAIVVLRSVLLPETAPQNWARIRLLQDHLENTKDTKLHQLNQEFLVQFLRDIGLKKKEVSDKEIHRACGILDSNAFENTTSDGIDSRALYPLSAMANSSCLPNMTHLTRKDRTMVMVASRDIEKGQELLICYTGIRWGKITRRKHLLLTKHFLCCCSRCLDPTECGTFISSIKCTECEGNMIQDCLDPTSTSQVESGWHCQECNLEMEHKKVVAVEAMIGQMLKIINKNSTNHLEGISRKLKRLLSCHHYILLEIYMSLITLYQKKNEKHERVVELCDNLLPVLEKLEGSSKSVAFLVLAKTGAQVALHREGKEEMLNSGWFDESNAHFLEAYSLIQSDVEAPGNIEDLKITIENLTKSINPKSRLLPNISNEL